MGGFFLLAFLKRDKTPKCREYILNVQGEENRDWEWVVVFFARRRTEQGVCERLRGSKMGKATRAAKLRRAVR